MKRVDQVFLNTIKEGDRIFKHPFIKSNPDEYTLYSVVSICDKNEIELIKVFDEKESLTKISRKKLLEEESWSYNPLFGK
jgi:hypothetical protein